MRNSRAGPESTSRAVKKENAERQRTFLAELQRKFYCSDIPVISLYHNGKNHQMSSSECPLANLAVAATSVTASSCPFHHHKPMRAELQESIPLAVHAGTHQVSPATAALLADIGGGDKIRELCTRFYARAFDDATLKPFFFEKDGATAHGKRLADWIIEKMGGEGAPWTDSGRLGMRQPSHFKAWNNVKRPLADRGNHFNLVDSRTWMRIHFWAAREVGLHEHKVFWDWYQMFIKHFIRVYERLAMDYVAEDANWSASTKNTYAYINNGNKMIDLE